MTFQNKRFFKHDVFISYARSDNTTGIVRALGAQLEEFLTPMLGWKPSIWFDDWSLDVKGDIENQIRTGLRDSAVFLVVTSEMIESRKWCRDEMGWFLNEARLDTVTAERVFPVFLPYSDYKHLPRWVEHLPADAPMIVDPARQELIAEQDFEKHKMYWNNLYGWFDRVSQAIVRAHAAFDELSSLGAAPVTQPDHLRG